MYLTYAEYQQMGGTLDSAAFSRYERSVERNINGQAILTAQRIAKLNPIPDAIKWCVFDLIELYSTNDATAVRVKAESQSQGGQSESITYEILTAEQIDIKADQIIYNSFSGELHNLLYRGVLKDD